MIHCFYRLSDHSYDKVKLPGTNKDVCLDNFLSIFESENITIIADNCNPSTIEKLRQRKLNVVESSLGNAGSARKAIELACELSDDAMVYLVEDDYLHHPDFACVDLIREGLQKAEYVTLYDHPDKYQDEYNYGETCKVFKTPHSHWRSTISTTMTVASKVKHLKDDLLIWHKYTDGPHPWDHNIFTEITQQKRKMLAVCIPGASCHVDLTYPATKRQVGLIEEWAVEMMEHRLAQMVFATEDEGKIKQYKSIMCLEPSMQKLIMLMGCLGGK